MAEKTAKKDDLGRIIGALRPSTWDEATRTLDVSLGTGAPVRRYSWDLDGEVWERLNFELNSPIDPARESRGLPVLRDHSQSVSDTLGRTVPGSFRVENGEALVKIRFSKAKKWTDLIEDVLDGVVGEVSAGYRRLDVVDTGMTMQNLPIFEVQRLEIFEVSLVGVRGDPGAGFRSLEKSAPEPLPVGNTEGKMSQKLPQGDTTQSPPAESTAPVPLTVPVVDLAKRNLEIRELARHAGTPEAVLHSLTDNPTLSLADGKRAIADDWIARKAAAPAIDAAVSRVQVTVDESETLRGAITDVLANRMLPDIPLTERAREYSYHSLIDFGREILTRRGARVRGKSPDQIVDLVTRGEFAAAGDFPKIFADVQEKVFVRVMAETPDNFSEIAQRRELKNFQALHMIGGSGLGKLNLTPPGGETQYTAIAESGETIRLGSYTAGVGVTRQALIDDDLSALVVDIQEVAQAVNLTKLDVFWQMFESNPTLATDSQKVFSVAHGNIDTDGGAPSVTEIERGILALGLVEDDKGSPMGLWPTHIIASPYYGAALRQLLGAMMPTQVGEVVPKGIANLKVIIEPRIAQGRFYLLSKDVKSPISYGVLRGQDTPFTDTWWDRDNDTMKTKVRYDFAAAWNGWRGVYLNQASGG